MNSEDYNKFYNNKFLEIECHSGLPVWSSRIPEILQEKSQLGKKVIWIVSDWKLNNADYETFIKNDAIFLDQLGFGNNVSTNYMTYEHIDFLAKKAMRAIDEVIRLVPNVKLIFWCLYFRSRCNVSSYPRFAWYDMMISHYKNYIIDIDDFTNPDDMLNKLTVDNGGHPNTKGYDILLKMLS